MPEGPKICATCQHRTTSVASRNTTRCGYNGPSTRLVDAWFEANWVKMDGKGGQSAQDGVGRIWDSCPGHTLRVEPPKPVENRRWIVVRGTHTLRGTGRVIAVGLTYDEALTQMRSGGLTLRFSARADPDPAHSSMGAYFGDPQVGDVVRYDIRTCEVFDPEGDVRRAADAFDAVFGTEEV